MSSLNISNFIWGIADDVLRDIYVRGKYRDVILPMTVIRRLDAVLEPTKDAVLRMKEQLDAAGIDNQDSGLRQASGESFYNASPFTLRDLTSPAHAQQLRSDFEAYLDGFSSNIQEVLEKFKFRDQIKTLVDADVLGFLIQKFLDRSINLSPRPVLNADGSVRPKGWTTTAWAPSSRSSSGASARRTTRRPESTSPQGTWCGSWRASSSCPVADQIKPSTYLVYDGACGTGGMLTVAEETLMQLADQQREEVSIHLFGQEVNPETYAISKADLILKGEGLRGRSHAVRVHAVRRRVPLPRVRLHALQSPYGKSWKSDLERMGGKSGITDPRFVVEQGGDPDYSLITRSSDGQMMFLANMVSKMKQDTAMGSRIAEVHNGSSLFTGDAGQGESNTRRWIIENDWLEAIIALPLNMFYNTGIATYIWVLSNRKAAHRKGKVQLIDATKRSRPLRKNLGSKTSELSDEDIRHITNAFFAFQETELSKIFPNEAFAYWKVTVERPLRLTVELSPERRQSFRDACRDAKEEPLANAVDRVEGGHTHDHPPVRQTRPQWTTGKEACVEEARPAGKE